MNCTDKLSLQLVVAVCCPGLSLKRLAAFIPLTVGTVTVCVLSLFSSVRLFCQVWNWTQGKLVSCWLVSNLLEVSAENFFMNKMFQGISSPAGRSLQTIWSKKVFAICICIIQRVKCFIGFATYFVFIFS